MLVEIVCRHDIQLECFAVGQEQGRTGMCLRCYCALECLPTTVRQTPSRAIPERLLHVWRCGFCMYGPRTAGWRPEVSSAVLCAVVSCWRTVVLEQDQHELQELGLQHTVSPSGTVRQLDASQRVLFRHCFPAGGGSCVGGGECETRSKLLRIQASTGWSGHALARHGPARADFAPSVSSLWPTWLKLFCSRPHSARPMPARARAIWSNLLCRTRCVFLKRASAQQGCVREFCVWGSGGVAQQGSRPD